MNGTERFIQTLREDSLEEWDRIPDIGLYMDQVIAFMKRQHIGLGEEGDEALTSAMINNYIKKGIMPRAKGKKYSREHIAYLTAICLLKQVLSVDDAGRLMEMQTEDGDIEGFYGRYRDVLGEEYSAVADSLSGMKDGDDRRDRALQLAVSGYAQILACRKILAETEDD